MRPFWEYVSSRTGQEVFSVIALFSAGQKSNVTDTGIKHLSGIFTVATWRKYEANEFFTQGLLDMLFAKTMAWPTSRRVRAKT